LDFENWTLKKNIGRGAYGKVFLVTHTYIKNDISITKNYAMKVYNKDNLVNHTLTEQTMNERNILLEMNHPYILNLHYAF
jgi:serine/threonine protein kinase